MKEPLQYDVESLFPLLAGVQPQDFPNPRLEALKAEPLPPPPVESVEPPAVELSPEPIQDGRDEMEVDAGGGGGAAGSEPMTIDSVEEGEEGVKVAEGMKTEVQQLERLKVGRCLMEKSGASEACLRAVLRWLLTRIELDELAHRMGTYALMVRNDAKAAISIAPTANHSERCQRYSLVCVQKAAETLKNGVWQLTGNKHEEKTTLKSMVQQLVTSANNGNAALQLQGQVADAFFAAAQRGAPAPSTIPSFPPVAPVTPGVPVPPCPDTDLCLQL
eukprot:s5264_g1.t1